MSSLSDHAGSLASDIVALTALPARWVGSPPERIAEDVAAALHHLSPGVRFVGVRLGLPGNRDVLARQPRDALLDAWPPPGSDGPRMVSAPNELLHPIGSAGRHGEIMVVADDAAAIDRARLLVVIAANQVDAACHTLSLERDVAQAHANVAAMGKLGALGQLVGGVAHEVRTPLTYATTNLYLLRNEIERLDLAALGSLAPRLDEMESAMDRIGAIVNQLRRFVKNERAVALEEDLRNVVQEALRLWRATHAGGSELAASLRPTPPVLVDRGAIQQVVLNLVQNADEALGGKGTIRISTDERDGRALLLVEDDGPGIAPAVLDSLFEPFRTTKRDGLGLGLSIVRRIVEEHGGEIRVDSALGRGTRMEVSLPRAAESA